VSGELVAELSIESLAYGGDGVAHLADGRTAFVAGACPGDVVQVKVAEDHGRFVRARIEAIVEPSADRVEPPCPYFGLCGGCAWQHVSAQVQLAAKRRAVVDALTRIGGIPAEECVAATVASPREYGYRNKIELVATRIADGFSLGYHKSGSEDIVPVESCLLLPPTHSKAPRALLGALRYLSGAQDLGIRRVGLRVGAHTRDVEVALWTSATAFPRQAAATTLTQALRTTSVVRVLTKGADKERKNVGVEVLAGKGAWRERLGGTTMTISAPSFFQVNTSAAETLVALVLDALCPGEGDRIIDVYAGAGTFTLPLAEITGEVLAIEGAGSAVRDLRRNLDDAGLYAEVIGGDAARELFAIGTADGLLIDPPRAGLTPEVIASAVATRAKTIVYVSCDPATLARDAKSLRANGYHLERATPVDMFPQTYHVETVAVFRRH
jgi:23S rRNA (uracil1939-C5)-methyltransferase